MSLAKFSLGLQRIGKSARAAAGDLSSIRSAADEATKLMERVRDGLSGRGGRATIIAQLETMIREAMEATTLSVSGDNLAKLITGGSTPNDAVRELAARIGQVLRTAHERTAQLTAEAREEYIRDARAEIAAMVDAVMRDQAEALGSSTGAGLKQIVDDVRAHTVRVADEIGPILDTAAQRFVRMRATAEVSMAATTAVTKEASGEVQTDLDRLRASIEASAFDVENFVSRQRSQIESIRTQGYGEYLDEYAKAFLKLSSGEEISPQLRADLQRRLAGVPQFVRLAGTAGREFDFAAFEADLLRLLRDSRDADRNPSRRAGKPDGGVKSTGRSGSPEAGCEKKGAGFSDPLRVGGWTGGN